MMEKVYANDPVLLKNIYLTLVTNSDITSTIPQLTQIIDDFREIIPNLQNLNDGKNDISKSTIPNDYSSNFYYLLEKITMALNEYAVMNENAELLSFISFTKECPLTPLNSDFKKKIKLILEYANRYLFAIERFGVKKHHLIEFEMEIGTCEKYNQMNEKELNEKVQALIRKIDYLVEGLKDKFPRFYNEYRMSKLAPVKGYSFENLSVW